MLAMAAAAPPARVAVLYHYPCPDGAFAALAASLFFRARGEAARFLPNAVYAPLRLEDLDILNTEVFYLLDFAGPLGFAENLALQAKRVVVLDHHKTAAENLPKCGEGPPNLLCILDMERSGATVAYDFFSRKLQEGLKQGETEPVHTHDCSSNSSTFSGGDTLEGDGPVDTESACAFVEREREGRGLVAEEDRARVEKLFAYIEDADLWRWKVPGSKGFSSGLKDLGLEYNVRKNSNLFDQLLSLEPTELVESGNKTIAAKQVLIDAAIRSAFVIQLGGGRFGSCLAVEGDDVAHLRSELGNQLAERSAEAGHRAIGAVVYREKGMQDASLLKVSLRSLGLEEDTTAISQAYGGGGHRNASSFLIGVNQFWEWRSEQRTLI